MPGSTTFLEASPPLLSRAALLSSSCDQIPSYTGRLVMFHFTKVDQGSPGILYKIRGRVATGRDWDRELVKVLQFRRMASFSDKSLPCQLYTVSGLLQRPLQTQGYYNKVFVGDAQSSSTLSSCSPLPASVQREALLRAGKLDDDQLVSMLWTIPPPPRSQGVSCHSSNIPPACSTFIAGTLSFHSWVRCFGGGA